MMELCNAVSKFDCKTEHDRAVVSEALKFAVQILSPITPHICEKLWCRLGGEGTLVGRAWPSMVDEALEVSQVELVVQVNGKVRGKILVPGMRAKKPFCWRPKKMKMCYEVLTTKPLGRRYWFLGVWLIWLFQVEMIFRKLLF